MRDSLAGPPGGLLIIETAVFTRQVNSILDEESYRLLQMELVRYPEAGALIPGSGGLRKVRWPTGGTGKRGGLRVIYYWHRSRAVLLLLMVYSKSGQDDLTKAQLRRLRFIVKGELQ